MIDKILLLLIFIICLQNRPIYSQDELKKSPEEDLSSIRKKGYSTDACYRMAEDFLRSGTDQMKAIPYLQYILEIDRNSRPRALYMLAQAYYYYGDFDRSIELMNEYIEKEKNKQLAKEAKIDLEQYKNAKRIASSPLNAVLVNLGPNINSKYAEINPYISNYEDLMVYSSNRTLNYNIYVSKKGGFDTEWNKAKQAGNYVNTINDEFVAGLSPSGKNLFVHYNQVSGFEDINMSIREKGLYRELGDPGTKINSSYREEGAFMTENGDTLFFASDRPGGFGGFDLYYSLKLPDGSFGTPINIGEPINTKFDENYPNLSPDGKKLYFASKGHNSMGGYDIFYTTFDSEKSQWTTPVNFGYPVNNAFDNKSITFTSDPRYAYISTVDWRTNGDYDIYKVVFLNTQPEYLIIKAELYIQDGNTKIPFKDEANDLEITVYSNGEIFGQYTYNKRNNSFVLALKPGSYILDLESEYFKPYKRKVNIKENYYRNNFRSLKINLEKNQE